MLRIEPQGDDVFGLHDRDGRLVGCVRGTSIRLGAFATERDAIAAALRGDAVTDAHVRGGPDRSPAGETAHVAASLAAHGARTGREPNVHAPRAPARDGDVRLVHDGAYEWVVWNRRPVARLVRPGAPETFGCATPHATPHAGDAERRPSTTFALEFVLPDAVPGSRRLTIARALHRAIDELARGAAWPARVAPARRADVVGAGAGTGAGHGARDDAVPPEPPPPAAA